MADKINIEIDLEGGAEVEKQLADIGKAGQQAFGDIQNAADQIDLSSATDALNNVQTAVEGAATFEKVVQSIGKVQSGFDALGNAASKMATRLTKSLGVLGVFARALGPVGIALGVAGGAFIKFGNDSANALAGLTTEAAKLGLTAQQLDTLQQAFGQLGVASDAIIPGLQKAKETLGGGLIRLGDVAQIDGFAGRLQNFIGVLEQMPDGVARTRLAMQQLGDALGGQVIAGLQTGTISATNFASALGSVTPATQQQIAQANAYQQALNQLNAAWTQMKGTIAPITTPIFQFLTGEVQQFKKDLEELRLEIAFVKGVWDVFKAGITGQDIGEAARKAVEEYKKLEDQLRRTNVAFTQSGTGLTQTTAGLTQTTQATAQLGQAEQQLESSTDRAQRALARKARAAEEARAAAEQARLEDEAWHQSLAFIAAQAAGINSVAGSINNLAEATARANEQAFILANAIRYIQSLPRPSPIGGGRPSPIGGGRPESIGFAEGGLLGGRGTGTSDSNLAWVSRGEHIMPARAVQQPGVLAFLEALRRSGGNLSHVLDGLGRFALGGLVPRSVPAFASGGSVGGMSHVTIQFPGMPPIAGLRASSAVVGELQKAAALAQVRSGGRKPSRYS